MKWKCDYAAGAKMESITGPWRAGCSRHGLAGVRAHSKGMSRSPVNQIWLLCTFCDSFLGGHKGCQNSCVDREMSIIFGLQPVVIDCKMDK